MIKTPAALGAVLIVVLVTVLGWLGWGRGEALDGVRLAAAGPGLATLQEMTPGAAAAPAPTLATPLQSPAPERPCMETNAGTQDPWTDAEARAQMAGLKAARNVLNALLADADPEARAAGLALQAAGFLVPTPDFSKCEEHGCADEVAQVQRDSAEAMAASGSAVAALAQLARSHPTPAIYAQALQACRLERQRDVAGDCVGLSAQQLAELDADNGALWLAVAEEALRRRDSSGQETAMHRMSLAHRFDMFDGMLMRQTLSHLPPELAVEPATQVAFRAIGVQFAQPMAFQGLVLYCSATQDANRRQVCERVVRLMLQQGTSLLDLGVGLSLGQKLGLPEAVLTVARTEKDAAQSAAAALVIDSPARPGQMAPAQCQMLYRMLSHLERVAQMGERAALRAAEATR